MVYSEVPNFSEPNPEYVAQMNKTVGFVVVFLCIKIELWS